MSKYPKVIITAEMLSKAKQLVNRATLDHRGLKIQLDLSISEVNGIPSLKQMKALSNRTLWGAMDSVIAFFE